MFEGAVAVIHSGVFPDGEPEQLGISVEDSIDIADVFGGRG